MARINEAEMADVVETILKRRPNKSATFAELRDMVPKHANLSRADRAKSSSRPGEQVWEQIVRNLVAHEREGFEGIPSGVCLEGYAPKAVSKPARKPTKARKAHKARKPTRKLVHKTRGRAHETRIAA